MGKASDVGRVVGVDQRYSLRRRHGILEKLDALAGQTLDLANRHVTECDQDIGPQRYQLRDELGNGIGPALAETVIDNDVLALDEAELLQPLAKSGRLDRVSRRSSSPDPADPRDLCLLLRAEGARRGHRACQQEYEVAASHAQPLDLAPSSDYGSTEPVSDTLDERRLATHCGQFPHDTGW